MNGLACGHWRNETVGSMFVWRRWVQPGLSDYFQAFSVNEECLMVASTQDINF